MTMQEEKKMVKEKKKGSRFTECVRGVQTPQLSF
jgi:hypothetical protein